MEMDCKQKVDPPTPEKFDLEEVPNASDEADEIIYAGIVEMWKMQEFSERAKIRPYIAGTVILIWVIDMLASAIRLVITGNFLLIVPCAIISVPLFIILRFYFKSG